MHQPAHTIASPLQWLQRLGHFVTRLRGLHRLTAPSGRVVGDRETFDALRGLDPHTLSDIGAPNELLALALERHGASEWRAERAFWR